MSSVGIQNQWEHTRVDPSILYDGPAELSDVRLLREAMRESADSLDGYALLLHPGGTRCEAIQCRGTTEWQRQLLKDHGVHSAYPFVIEGSTLTRIANEKLKELVMMLSGRETQSTMPFEKPIPPHPALCEDAVLLRVPDTANFLLAPLVAAAIPRGPVPEKPREEFPSQAAELVLDLVSSVQLAAVGFTTPDETAAIRLISETTHSPTHPYVASACDIGNGAEVVSIGPLPLRVSPPIPTPPSFGGPPDFSDPASAEHLTPTTITSGGDPSSARQAEISRTLLLPCRDTVSISIRGVLDEHSHHRTRKAYPDGEHLTRAHVTLYAPLPYWAPGAAPPEEVAMSEAQGSGLVVSGTVQSANLLVNRITRRLYWSVSLLLDVGCANPLHTLENSSAHDTPWVEVLLIAPDRGTDLAKGERIAALALPSIQLSDDYG